MLLKGIRRMYGLRFQGQRRWAHHFLLVIWLSLLAATPPGVFGYFLGDTKAVLNGCKDHWTLQDRAAMPLLFQMTVCVDIRVVVPGAWVAFSYSSVHAPQPELGLEGDDGALYGWLLRVRHRFPLRLSPAHWHRVCLRRDVPGNSFSLEVDGKMVAERTVIAQAIPPSGSLWLGCRPRDRPPGAVLGEVEVYLFRIWADLGDHGLCEDGTVIGWNAQFWGLTSPNARQRDPNLMCVHRRLKRGARGYRSINGVMSAHTTGFGRSFSPPPDVHSPTTTSSPVIATPVTDTRNQTEFTASTSPGGTTVYSSQPLSVTPSTNVTSPTTLSELDPTTDSTTADWTPSNTTVPATGEKTKSDPAPVSPIASHQTATADVMSPTVRSTPPSNASPPNQMSTSTKTSSITTLPHKQTTPRRSLMSGSSLVNCDISKLCSDEKAYFWMFISVEAKGGSKTEQDVHSLVSKAFGCGNDRAETGFIDFCQGNRQAQVIEVNCRAKRNISDTNCHVLLQLTHAVSACELQHAGISALQRAGDEQIQARIIGEVERVGRDLCGDMSSPSGGFVRCTSSSSLDDICQANQHSNLTCSLIEPNSIPAPQPKTEPCGREAPRFCDCTAFCNSASQFFAIRLNINSAAVNISLLQKLLSSRLCNTGTGSECQEISKHYKGAHLECHGTQHRLYSCMVIMEMSGPVSGCSLSKLLQQLIDSNSDITNERPLTRMVVCGPPGLPVHDLLASNLTWVASDLLTSDTCQPDPTLLKCEANETLAVLLSDSCPPKPLTTNPSTAHPSTQTKSNITTATEATASTVTNTTQQTNATSENTPATHQENASQGTTQPYMTTPFSVYNSTQSSTAQPVLQTSSQNVTVYVSNNTTPQNTTSSDKATLLTPTENTKLQNTTAAQQNTSESITLSSVSSTPPNTTTSTNNLQNATTICMNSTLNTTTLSPNHTTEYNVTTADTFTPSPNDTTTTANTFTLTHNATTEYNVTTISAFTPSPNHTTEYNVTTADTFTPSPNDTTLYNVTTADTFTTSPNNTMEYNVTTANTFTLIHNATTAYNVTTISAFTPSPNDTTVYNITTADSFTPTPNDTTEYNITTINAFTPTPNDTTEYNITTSDTFTLTPNATTEYNITTANIVTPSPNDTILYNVTTADTFTTSPNNTMEYNVTTISAFTPSPNDTTVYNITTTDIFTPSPNDTTLHNATTADTFTPSPNDTTEYNITTANAFTPSPNHTAKYNLTTADTFTPTPNVTRVYNVTTAEAFTSSYNHTTEYNLTTANTFTPSPNHTKMYNVTTAINNGKLHNSTNSTRKPMVSTFTASPNHTIEYNATTASNNYTTKYNVTTASNNYTTEYNATTASNNYTTVYNVTTASNNYTTKYNVTTASNNYTTKYNVTTASNNYTTVDNKTAAISNLHNGTSNATISAFTASPNYTTVYNVTTASKNYTTASNNFTVVYNVTTAGDNMNSHNITITSKTTISTLTTSSNYTMMNNETTASNNYTTAENITTTTISQNKTTADNVTTAPIRGTQQNTTVPYKNTTVSTTARPVNETPYNATTSTKNSTVDNMTSVVDNTTKTTVAPLNNQTTNYTTVSVPNNSATTNRNYTNSTTPASGFSPTSNLNTTAGTSFNLSSTASSLTTEINITTKGPGVNLTIAANTSLEDISTTSTSTMTTTATTAHGQLPAQDNTTTATVSLPSTTTTTTLQTTTLTSTTNTIAGTGITSTTTEETINSQVAQDEQADALLNETQDASRLNSSQVVQLVGNLEKLLDGPAVSQTVGEKTINIVSNLMQVDSEALSASANRLIQLVDILGLKLAVTGDRAILSSNSLVLAVRTVDGTNFPTTSVNIFNTNNVQFRGLSRSQSGSSQPSMGSIFLPSSITEGLSPEEQQQASRVQFTFYTKSTFFQDAALKNQTLVSPVLGSSVANMSISNLKENIQFTIQNTNPIHANFVASCVFWDFTLNGGGGGWSSAGCSLVNATPEDTTCSCNHLTSFAILLDMSRQEMTDRQQAQILTFITYIGCGVSAIFLAVTILTYLSFQKLLRDIPAKILVQLCMSLFLLNLVFLLDGWLALYPATGLCISTAFFLHYFLLTSFTWAGLEALHMYLSIVQVFTPYLSRYMLKFTLMGWGIPLTVVIVVISVDKDNYGLVTYGKYTDGTSDDFCWLRNDIAFYVGVVAYFILIFVLCLLVFIVVMVQLARIKKQNPQNQSPNRGVMTDLRSIAGLILLLGLTWGFALFAWGPLYLPFVYLFSIFNSLQGFFIFVFHCAVKENVRKQWRTYLCCGKLRLAENSEWSRTATQNNRNLSVTTATTSALHLTSRSSSVISDSTNSSGSVFVDSGISDGSNSDVVLNELHRRNLSPQTEA